MACSWNSVASSASCDTCNNNFYPTAPTAGVNQCTQCPGTNYDRCTGSSGATITQCGGDRSKGEETYATAIPHTNQYYLVLNKENTKACVQNVNECMMIKEKSDDTS